MENRVASPAGARASLPAPVSTPVETFTDAERARLAPHFTNLDRPVFALVNLPETVKGALFARYSRYPGTLRRLFLDEFADSLPEAGARPACDGDEGERAAELYERIFLGYGDDSVAQLGGAHVACEWVSNVLTKVLQRPRLGAYLEQSTRYIAYDAPMPGGGYRYYRDPTLGAEYERRWTSSSTSTRARCRASPRGSTRRSRATPSARAHARGQGQGAGPAARRCCPRRRCRTWASTPRARPTSSSSCTCSPTRCPRRARYGAGDPRGGQGRHAVASSRASSAPTAAASGSTTCASATRPPRAGSRASGWTAPGATERRAAVGAAAARRRRRGRAAGRAALRGRRRRRGGRRASASPRSAPTSAPRCCATSSATRANRRHRPGRGFEALRYRFEIVSDYGAFRDLQRHRMLTVQWQRLTPHLGAGVPEEVDAAGCGDDYRRALERLARPSGSAWPAPGASARPLYALCLGYRIRYVLDLNAREAMQLIELRSGREGHPSYRAVAHEMHRLIAAVHPAVAATMTHVDTETEPRLERILSEMRTQAKLDALAPAPGTEALCLAPDIRSQLRRLAG